MRWIVFLLLMIFCLCSCSQAIDESDPSDMVIQYFQAKVAGDKDALQGLLCSELESTLNAEARSFSTVKAELVDATCNFKADNQVVACAGVIVADYNGENTEFQLTSYRVVQEDGAWKWCGEATTGS